MNLLWNFIQFCATCFMGVLGFGFLCMVVLVIIAILSTVLEKWRMR